MKSTDEVKPIYRVLIIEEDPQQTELYTDLIREIAECKVDVMSQVESSFEWIGRSSYQLVIVDTPKGSLKLLEHIKRMSPATGVILVSEEASVEEAVAAIRLGAEDYLKKPFSLEFFQLAVKRSLDRKVVFAEDGTASGFLSLLNSCQLISATLDQNKIFEIIQSYFARELKCGYSAIYCLQGSDPIRVSLADQEDDRQDRAVQEILDIALHASNPLPKMVEGSETYRFLERGQLTPGLFLFRFQCAGHSDYFCVGLAPERPSSMDEFESRLRILKTQLELTGKNIEQYQGVQHLVYVDDATGLYNTRYLNYILDREIAHFQSSARPFAVLFIDADKFKGVNDTHGHLAGTKLLHELGGHLKRFVRDSDTVFRYGGDEFVAVLSSCDLPTAKLVAERIRHSVEEKEFLESEGIVIKFTVSIGVAIFPDHAKTKKEIIDAADQAMYASKKRSRNSVTIADLPQPVPAPAPVPIKKKEKSRA